MVAAGLVERSIRTWPSCNHERWAFHSIDGSSFLTTLSLLATGLSDPRPCVSMEVCTWYLWMTVRLVKYSSYSRVHMLSSAADVVGIVKYMS